MEEPSLLGKTYRTFQVRRLKKSYERTDGNLGKRTFVEDRELTGSGLEASQISTFEPGTLVIQWSKSGQIVWQNGAIIMRSNRWRTLKSLYRYIR